MWFSSVLLVSPLLLAQTAANEPPLTNRPANFSRVVGQFRIESLAEPTLVEVEKPVLLKVRITGEGEKGFLPQRKFLKIFPDQFADQFFVEDLPELDRLASADKTWEFAYRLRPKSTAVEFIPGLKLVYYHPSRKKYASSFTEAIPLTVKPAAQPELPLPAAKVILAPESFFQTASAEASLSWRPATSPGPGSLLELLALGVAVFLLFAFGRRGTDRAIQSERARLHLEYATSIRHLRGAMINYLHRRLHLKDPDWIGAEVIQSLRRLGMERALLIRFQTFFAECDEARFSPNPAPPEAALDRLSADAQQLIHFLEADPCAARSA
jgi:hypothetical protein